MNNFDRNAFLRDLGARKWHKCFTNDINDALDHFVDIFQGCLNKHAPIKHKKVKRIVQPKWWNEDIAEAIRTRDRLKKHGNIPQYKKARNNVVNLIKKAKSAYYQEALVSCSGNSKKLWQHMKDVTKLGKGGHNKVPSIKCEEILITNPNKA